MSDDDYDPIRTGPPEPPGPPPRRRWTFERKMLIAWAIVTVAAVAVIFLVFTQSPWGVS